MYYVPQILKAGGLCDSVSRDDCDRTILLWSLLPAGTNAVGTVVGIVLVDRVGRRLLLLSSIVGVIITLLGFGLTCK